MLSGILPISRVSAIPLCIYHAARLIPLEKVLGLAHPSLSSPAPKDKRTWREGMRPEASGAGDTGQQRQKEDVWTAMDILTAYATKKGWVTAKAGRPDVNRAGNASTCIVSYMLSIHRRLRSANRALFAPQSSARDDTVSPISNDPYVMLLSIACFRTHSRILRSNK